MKLESENVKPAWESNKINFTIFGFDILDHSSLQIRLLTLFPADNKAEPIQCKLETILFPTKNRPYEALSYAWGSPSAIHPITLNNRPFKVPSNLHTALCYLRHEHVPRTLWIDALCINQIDSTEKSHQVRQMRSIYAGASRVLVWLGEADVDIDQAMEYLNRPSPAGQEPDENPVKGLQKIVTRSWWSRTWVIQEVFVSPFDPVVLCGDKSASWARLIDALESVTGDQMYTRPKDRFVENTDTFYMFIITQQRFGRERMCYGSLQFWLLTSIQCEAEDPRDRVYALLGLVGWTADEQEIEADYERTESEVWQSATVNVIRQRKDLEWLIFAPSGDVQKETKPSWCVDYSVRNWVRGAVERRWKSFNANGMDKDCFFFQFDRLGASTGRMLACFTNDIRSGSITVTGIEIGRIDFSSPSTCGKWRAAVPIIDSFDEKNREEIGDEALANILFDTSLFTKHAYLALKKRLSSDEAARKLAGGDVLKVSAGGMSFEELMKTHKDESQLDGYSMLMKAVSETDEYRKISSSEWGTFLPDEPDGFVYWAKYALLMIAYESGDQSFFTTSSGYIGLAGHTTQTDDVLCILFGCSRPAVLRPQEDGSFKLVTFTYTDNVMNGEFLEDNNPDEEKSFVLR